jgi:hypothetical protein
MNFDRYNIPMHTRGALERYVVNGYEPGSFLMAVLTNDLMGAVGRADDMNRYALFDICLWLYNEAPSNCHGSFETVVEYIKAKRNIPNE